MAATLPQIAIVFKQKAATFFDRSTRGVLFLIVREANPDTESEDPLTPYVQEITDATDLTAYSETNQRYIKDALAVAPFKLFVVAIDTAGAISTATDLIEITYPTGRVTMVGVAADYSALVTWAKAKKKYHVLTHNVTGSNSRYIENLYAQQIVWDDDDHGTTGEQSSVTFLPTLAAILCKANVRGVTYKVLDSLKAVTMVGDETAENNAINAGNLILRNDWRGTDQVVRLGTAVNTLTTFTENEPEDFRYIEVAEAADMIREDIASTFRDEYVGRVKNSTTNQYFFLSDVYRYFDQLIEEEVLNGESAPVVDIDVAAQRAAWIPFKPEAADWDDDEVKQHPFKRKVFVFAAVQILQSMQDLTMEITLD